MTKTTAPTQTLAERFATALTFTNDRLDERLMIIKEYQQVSKFTFELCEAASLIGFKDLSVICMESFPNEKTRGDATTMMLDDVPDFVMAYVAANPQYKLEVLASLRKLDAEKRVSHNHE